MALTAVKTWIAAEVLYAADLTGEFANIYNNGMSLGNPWTAHTDAAGFDLTAVDEAHFNNASADASAAGRLRRNATNLTWHNGTAAGRIFYSANTDFLLAAQIFS